MSEIYTRNAEPLVPLALAPLPLGSVRPEGWLRRQLQIQANGLSGHLDEFWPDLGPDNMWLGGNREGWERGPYYADGLVPLAYLLNDDTLKAKAQKWVEAFLTYQDETGWIGPVQAPKRPIYDAWPNMVVMKVLSQYHEATGDGRALDVMERFCRYLHDYLDERPLFSWGAYRCADLALCLFWLYHRIREPWLLEVAAKVRSQSYDWTAHYTNFVYTEKMAREECKHPTHVVNNGMAVKAPGVWYRLSRSESDRAAVAHALANLDRYHGQVNGMFSGDEHYAGREPYQGTELCAVVEFMFSLECLLSILGEPSFGDRLERVAYNALPATFSPDMWAHQYDQQVNQVLCSVAPRRWTNNGPRSNLFGLEPNYGCCTANMHQGWPKFASHLWMACPGDGLAAVAYAPCRVRAKVRGGVPVSILEETDYPFNEVIRIAVQCPSGTTFPLWLRIPGWAKGATARVAGGSPQEVPSGVFHVIERSWNLGDVVELHLPMAVQAVRRLHGAVALERGPLVFSLKMGEEWRLIGGEIPHGDWEVHPTTPWNYALVLDPNNPGAAVALEKRPVGECPFSPEGAPLVMKVPGRRVPQWQMEEDSAGPAPESPVATEEPVEELTLIPYGCTNLRVTEFPVAKQE